MNSEMIEKVSAAVHDEWMRNKRSKGITSRTSETGEELMVPYDQLSEAAKDLDRGSVSAVLGAAAALGMLQQEPQNALEFAVLRHSMLKHISDEDWDKYTRAIDAASALLRIAEAPETLQSMELLQGTALTILQSFPEGLPEAFSARIETTTAVQVLDPIKGVP